MVCGRGLGVGGYHAGCDPDDVTFFRIGTSGGLGRFF